MTWMVIILMTALVFFILEHRFVLSNIVQNAEVAVFSSGCLAELCYGIDFLLCVIGCGIFKAI